MNSSTRPPLIAFLFAVLFAFATVAAHAAGTVTFVEGKVSVLNDKGETRAPQVKDRLAKGDTIVTGEDGELHFMTDDRGAVSLRPNTRLRIDDYVAKGGVDDRAIMTLTTGFLRSVTGWIGKIAPRNFEVRARNATIGIRGTDLEAGVIAGGANAGIYAKVNSGGIVLSNAGGQVNLSQGQAAQAPLLVPGPPKTLARLPDVFRPSKNEKAFEETKANAEKSQEGKLKEQRADAATGTKDCFGPGGPAETLQEFVRAYESGNLAKIRSWLDPKMVGYQQIIDDFIKEINQYKQVRLLVKDINVQCGPDLASIQFTWEKRFLDVNSFQPGLFTGRAAMLMQGAPGSYRFAALSGDRPIGVRGGVLARLVFGPTFSLSTVMQASTPVPVTLEVNDPDKTGAGSVRVQITTSNADLETLDLAEQSPGQFIANSLNVSSRAAQPGNGVVEVANGIELTMRYIDDNPGANLPPRLITASLRPTGSLPTITTPTNTTPTPFSFLPVTDVTPGATVTSNSVAITGITAPAPISVAGGSYSINGGAFTSASGTITNGQNVVVRLVAPGQPGQSTSATLTIGGVSGIFTVSTVPVDTTPDPFIFNTVNNATPNTLVTSNTITISGINLGVSLLVAGGEVSINGGAFASGGPFTVQNGNTVAVRVLSPFGTAASTTASVTIGSVIGSFTVNTTGAVTTPNAFSFTPVSNAALDTNIDSNTVTIGGINVPAPISVTGGSYSINAGAFVTSAGTISNGQTLTLRVKSAAQAGVTKVASVNVGSFVANFSVTTLAANTTPNAFSFTPVTNVAPSSTVTSNIVTIGGINAPAPVTISGGLYSINGGAFTSSPGTINNGQTVQLQATAPTNFGTTGSVTLTVGGVSGTFSITTAAANTTPNAFSFTPQSGVAAGATVTSNTVTISGINAPAPISVTGGSYSINGGPFTTAAGTISNGQTVALRMTAPTALATSASATLTVGGVSASFTVTTVGAVIAPAPFSFTAQTGVALNTLITSNTVTISGINTASPISITGGQYSINGGAFTSASGTITNGQSVNIQVLSSRNFSTTTSATLTIGGVSGTFSVTTTPQITTPNAFSFTPVTNAAQSTLITSNTITISGINAPAPISIVGGSYSINNGTFTTSAAQINNGDTLRVAVTSSASFSTSTSATVTVGGFSATFTVTTQAANTTPNAFTFTPVTNATPSTSFQSNVITISGINAPAPISVTGGSYSINSGPFTTASGTITNGQTLTLFGNSSAVQDGTGVVTVTVTVGGYSTSFTITTRDLLPNSFSFPLTIVNNINCASVAGGGVITSSSIVTITGITAAASVSVSSGATYSVNGGAFVSSGGTITNGQTLQIRRLPPMANSSAITTVTVGLGSGTWTITCQ